MQYIKQCILIIFILLLIACTSDTAEPYTPYQGETKLLHGANLFYQPFDQRSLQIDQTRGKNNSIIHQPLSYSQQGTALIFNDQQEKQPTLIGESISNDEFIGAHAHLPLPSYVMVTNMQNGRQLVVRLIDRQPDMNHSIITLSKRVADRLLLTEQTPIQVDYIEVTPEGTINGLPGETLEELKQNYPLPERPDNISTADLEVE